MAISLVKAGAINDAGGGSGTGSATFGQSTTSGDLLIAWLSSVSSNPSVNPFGTSSAGWTLAAVIGQAFAWAAVYYKANCGAGETAPTFTQANGPGGSWWIQLAEFAGAATVSPLDQTGTADNSGTGAAPNTATAGGVDSAAGDLIVSSWTASGSNTSGHAVTAAMTDSNNSAVTPTLTSSSNSDEYCAFALGIAGATLGTHADTAQSWNTISAERSEIVIASFKPAGAASSAAPAPYAPGLVALTIPGRSGWQGAGHSR